MGEKIGERIARMRGAKGWSRPELGRRMAKAIGREKPFSGEAIRRYEEGMDRPKGEPRRALAEVFEQTEAYIEFGAAAQHTAKQQEGIYASPRDELLLELFRGLTPEQQREQMQYIRALYEANRQIQARLGGPLRTISNEDVERAYGKVPSPKKPSPRKQKKRPGFAEEDPE